MHSSFTIILLFHLSWSFPIDTAIIQIQHTGVVGRAETVDRVLVNGLSPPSRGTEVADIIKTLSVGSPLRSLEDEVFSNQTADNHTFIRLRECKLDGSGQQVHLTDSLFYDGAIYLMLDWTTDTWTAQRPQAVPLKTRWDQEPERTRKERIRLQEGCPKLMDVLMLSADKDVPQVAMPAILVPILALLVFSGLILVSLLIAKKQGMRHPGGVIGSVIHYPQDITDLYQDGKGHHNGYDAL